jgi:hypothetical protein
VKSLRAGVAKSPGGRRKEGQAYITARNCSNVQVRATGPCPSRSRNAAGKSPSGDLLHIAWADQSFPGCCATPSLRVHFTSGVFPVSFRDYARTPWQ